MNTIYNKIKGKTGQIALLIDPEKVVFNQNFDSLIEKIKLSSIHFIFVGGSSCNSIQCNEIVSFLKKRIHQPIILFPGSPKQFTKEADALLYLSLISGRNPKYLIGEHVKSAITIKKSKIEVLSTSYIIINKEIKSSVLTVSNTLPISPNEPKKVLQHALAGELQGKKITFLDAGSGAINTIPLSTLAYIRSHTSNPIIIGGGINKISQIDNYTKLGANVIVIGNAIEKDEKFIDEINHFFEIKKD
jgi:putative glycerol-1-phosphate prenyltransferase